MRTVAGLRFTFLFVVLAFVSCEKTDMIDGGNGGPSVSTVNKQLILQLVNNARQSGCNCGTTYMPPVNAVTWNNLLEQAAYNHALDMQTNNFFSHTGSDGSNGGQRISRAGYNWRVYGENIAKGYPDESSVVAGWLQSPSHCRNIMDASFREMGVARAGNYWVQEFGNR